VDVYLKTEKPEAAAKILSSVDSLVAALGFDGPFDVEMRSGSIFRRSIARLKRGLKAADVPSQMAKFERAVELAQVDRRQADVDDKLASAAGRLLDSLKDVPEACVRVGSILIVKYQGPRGQHVLVRTMSSIEVQAWERFPGIQADPRSALTMLATAVASLEPAHIEGGSTPR
jgi:hypothetical protein